MRTCLGRVAALAIAAAAPLAGTTPAAAHSAVPGQLGGYGPGWGTIGPGFGHGWMMGPGYPGRVWRRGPACGPPWTMPGFAPRVGPGRDPRMAWGFGPIYLPGRTDLDLSPEDVKDYLEGMIRNPNLKVGRVAREGDDAIVAEIVTTEKDALVQRFEFDRHSGRYRPKETR